jgi:AAA ATPase domain/Protein of unknown function (DUF3696)
LPRRPYRTIFSRVRLRNFRCYLDSGDVTLRPLTIIVGPNNSGKSTLMDALLLLKQTLAEEPRSEPLITSGGDVDMGGYFDILRGGSDAKNKTFTVEVESAFEGFNRDRLIPSRGPGEKSNGRLRLSVTFEFDKKRNAPSVHSVELSRDGKIVVGVTIRGGRERLYGVERAVARGLVAHVYSFLPFIHGPLERTPARTAKKLQSVTRVSNQIYVYWANVFSGLHHIPPARGDVPRIGVVGQTTSRVKGGTGEELLRMLKSKEKVEGSPRTLEEEVDRWISGQMKILRKMELKRIDPTGNALSLLGTELDGFTGINVANMGQGISQLLPIGAHVLGAGYDDCVIVEQPEIHLHPALQAALGDLFVDKVVGGNAHQIIIETHSEHLLLRIRRRVAEGRIPASDVVVLYVDRQAGQSKVTQIDIDPKGELSHWPEGFFEEDFEEAYHLSRAAQRRAN